MEPNHDEQIVCTDCGETFVFTLAEAAFYEQKNLAAPPKRCKACRLARKSARPQNGERGGRPPGRPRYTGDVNEYRSPMQDNSFSPPLAGRGPRGRDASRDGIYRAPAFRGGARPEKAAGPARAARSGPPATPPRAHGAMFDATCVTCGIATQVPFRPIAGRDVFCQPCYRARKPLPSAG